MIFLDTQVTEQGNATICHANVVIDGEDVRLETFAVGKGPSPSARAFERMEKVLKALGFEQETTRVL